MTLSKPYKGILPITSEFGQREFRLSDGSMYRDIHNGIDIGARFSVLSAGDGVVVATGTNGVDRGGALVAGTPANYVIVDHGNGIRTFYWHLESVDVFVGQRVSRGQALGVSGRTGEATGVHLHFIVEVNRIFVNPRSYIDFNSDNIITTSNMARKQYTVVGGDSLYLIAQKVYGNGDRYTEIAALNGIATPFVIHPGQVIYYEVPDAPVQNNTTAALDKLKLEFKAEKDALIKKQQDELTKEQAKLAKLKTDYETEIQTLSTKYETGELESRSEIERLSTLVSETTLKLEHIEKVRLEILGINSAIFVDILDETGLADGILGRYAKFIDSFEYSRFRIVRVIGKSKMLKSILKYDIFVVVGAVLTYASIGALFPDLAESAKQFLSFAQGILVKVLLTRYDTNGDGKLTVEDTQVLKEYKNV